MCSGVLAAAAHAYLVTEYLLISQLVLAHCLTVVAHGTPGEPRPVVKIKIELKPLEIECELTDFITISAPVTKAEESRYFLYSPNGEGRALNISRPKYKPASTDYEYNKVNFIENRVPIITPTAQFEVFNVNRGLKQNAPDIFAEKKAALQENQFMVGPLDYGDSGNWVLSLYSREDQREWTEAFRVITLRIIESVPARPDYGLVRLGDTFSLQFAYPIEDIESCELTAPRSTFDRLYTTDGVDRKYCGYVIRNVTEKDVGMWEITGVGRIVYKAHVDLKIIPRR